MTEPRPTRFDRVVAGILLLDKPPGISSNAALQQARTLLRALKAGHAGSLDPLATGLLPICFGQATKVCGYLLESRKTYRVAALLGIKTDSADADGQVIERQPVPVFAEPQLHTVLQSFLGAQQQVPPMYSALKHGGQRLYDLARSGRTVERAPRAIVIEHIELIGLTPATIEFEVRCSKGTYVRSLVEDIAARLGTVGHVTALRRTQIDPFITPMTTLDALQALSLPERDALLLPADAALLDLPELLLDADQALDLCHGKPVSGLSPSATGSCRAYGPERRFLGIVKAHGHGPVQAERLFTSRPVVGAQTGASVPVRII